MSIAQDKQESRPSRVVILILAYEAEHTLAQVVREIPKDIYEMVSEIIVQDDHSRDRTAKVAEALCRQYDKLRLVVNERNLGYGGTKKKAYKALLQTDFDAVVLLHGDGQLPSQCLGAVLEPVLTGKADIVLGSRILGAPLSGGMPFYKFLGNRLLSFVINTAVGERLTDYHTGYRAYSRTALSALQVDTCGDGHEISMQLLLRAFRCSLRVVEVAVPTYYGEGSRSVSFTGSVTYGLQVLRMIVWKDWS